MPPSAEYDSALLQDAPKLDKRTIQEGYSTDILREAEKQSRSNSTVPEHSGRQPQRGNTNESSASREALAAQPKALEAQSPPPKPRPFWKTTKGLIIIGAGVVIVIVAAVVGGVVGGRKKNNTNTGDPLDPTQGTGGNGGTGQTGQPVEGETGQNGGTGGQSTTSPLLPVPSDLLPSSTSSADSGIPSAPNGLEGTVETPPSGDDSSIGVEPALPQPNSGLSIERTGLD